MKDEDPLAPAAGCAWLVLFWVLLAALVVIVWLVTR
jgi:hypothetical protein